MGRSPKAVLEAAPYVPGDLNKFPGVHAFHAPTNIIYVSFDKLFEIDKDYNYFQMWKRRCFSKGVMLDLICEVLNTVFDTSEDIIERYAEIRMKITEDSEMTKEDFKEELSLLIKMCMPIAERYVDEHYQSTKEDRDEDEDVPKKGRRSNSELQFNNNHSKMLLRISFCIKLILPLLMHYTTEKKISNFDEFYLSIIEPCFTLDKMAGKIDIVSKIYKIIDSRIKTTRYSDKVIWRFIRAYFITGATLANDFLRKILIEIIPKLAYRDCISYLHVTVKFLIRCQFKYKFPLNFYPLNLAEAAQETSKDLSNLERIEFNLVRIDESDGVLTQAKIQDMLIRMLRDKQFHISAQEFSYYKKHFQINSVQTQLLFLFLAKKIGRVNALYNMQYNQYIFCLIYFKKWLENSNFPYLSRWIAMDFANAEVESLNNNEFTSALMKSKRFMELNENKYKYMIGSFSRNNVISKLISAIISNQGELILNYEESERYKEFCKENNLKGDTDDDIMAFLDEEGIEHEYSMEHIIDEVLRFIEVI